jgi:hypothetical protein
MVNKPDREPKTYTVICFRDPKLNPGVEEPCEGWFFYAKDQAEARKLWENCQNHPRRPEYQFVCVLDGFVDYWRGKTKEGI